MISSKISASYRPSATKVDGSMSGLKLYLFGQPRLEQNGEGIKLRGRKILALAAYLAATKQHHSRDALAALLWPDFDPAGAKANLRRELSRLNRVLGEGYLVIERNSVGLSPESTLWLDVTQFQDRLASCQTHGHPTSDVCSDCLPPLSEAAELYTADFLSGFTLSDSPEFDEWQFFQAEGLRQQLASALERLAAGYSAQGNFETAIPHARRWLSLDSLHEPAHQQLMKLYAWSGQQAAALRQYQECERILEEELGVPPSEETTALYEAIKAKRLSPPTGAEEPFDLAQDRQGSKGAGEIVQPSPLPPSPSSPRHNLPSQPTPFIGREVELTEIAEQLADSTCRMLTILGAGGMGKTRLSLEVARLQLTHFADGVTFVPLAPVQAADFTDIINPLAATIADALKISFHDSAPPEEQLLTYLSRKEMLLVLDNFEHLVETANFLSNLLAGTSNIKLLVTSRERLNLQEEWLFALQGLPFPEKESSAQALDPLAFSAIQLFTQQARQVKPGFDLAAELPALLDICQLVEGMPLGLELAAAWVRQLSCQEIATEVARELDFLSSNVRNLPDRHRSMRAVFTYSWQRLTASEQQALQKLSVFRGGFRREAAQVVAGASLRLLSSLVDQSLLRRNEDGRYEIHELLRQFAAEKLAQSPTEENEARNLHGHYFLTFVEEQGPKIQGAEAVTALAAIVQDIDNVRAAVRWAVNHQRHLFSQAVGVALRYFYEVQGWYLEGEATFSLISAKLKPDCTASEPAEKQTTVSPECLRWAQYHSNLGLCQWRLGRLPEAEETIQQSLLLLPPADLTAQWVRGWCLVCLGMVAYSQEEYTRAQALLKESGTLLKAADDSWSYAVFLIVRGQVALYTGDYDEAQHLVEASERILSALGDRIYSCYVLSDLGRLAAHRGEFAEAEAYHQASLAGRREMGHHAGLAFTLRDLGYVAQLQGRNQEARDYYEQSIATANDINMPQTAAGSLWSLGDLAVAEGNFTAARYYFQESRLLYRTHQRMSSGPGWAALGLGELSEAKQLFQADLQKMLNNDAKPMGLDALVGLVHIQAQAGQLNQALELLALVQHHPASNYEIKEKVRQLREELTAELPSEQVAEAETRGRELDLRETAEALLAELIELGGGVQDR